LAFSYTVLATTRNEKIKGYPDTSIIRSHQVDYNAPELIPTCANDLHLKNSEESVN